MIAIKTEVSFKILKQFTNCVLKSVRNKCKRINRFRLDKFQNKVKQQNQRQERSMLKHCVCRMCMNELNES